MVASIDVMPKVTPSESNQTQIKKLSYSQFGDPITQLSIVSDEPIASLEDGQVRARVLYAPVNPVDFIVVGGHFPFKPQLPATPGQEGVIKITQSASSQFQAGDRAVFNTMVVPQGLWRQEIVTSDKVLVKLPQEIPDETAATIVCNPTTAYILIHKFTEMKPGDCLIQNAANSSMGQIIIQLASLEGFKTINVIRNRENFEEVAKKLKAIGGNVVITDEDLVKGLKNLNLNLPTPKLAIDCVGGKAANELSKSLSFQGTLIACGTLSGQPLQIEQIPVIMNDLTIKGFTLNSWSENPNCKDEYHKIVRDLLHLYATKQLESGHTTSFPMSDWQSALTLAAKGFTNTKVLLKMN